MFRFTKTVLMYVICAVALSAAFFSGCSRDSGARVVIKGSTTVLPITQKEAELYREISKTPISIDGSGSGNGIKALLDGNCDIANSSREMKKEELAAAKTKGIAVKEITVAYDMIVPVVNPSNPVSNLSLAQLKGIYDGKITSWKQLGGKDELIVVISRDTSSGTYEIWQSKVMGDADIRTDALLQASNGAILNSIAANPRAIGYIGFGYLDSSVKGVTLDNVPITIENGKSGKFPVSRKLYMYVNENKLSKEASAFIDFLLSEKGQSIVKETGFIPLK
ncbi:MAG: PstS family phosphate ABC transporter substrate-binding protein [Spirochaetota bacterium]